MFKSPKNSERFLWTKHAASKMRFYGLSEQKVKGVLANPKRREEGIAPKTLAAMRPAGSKRPSEIWVMYRITNSNLKSQSAKMRLREKRVKIISAWRYPGKSPVRSVPVPDDIRRELENFNDGGADSEF